MSTNVERRDQHAPGAVLAGLHQFGALFGEEQCTVSNT
jgi:hypothetical protein